MKQKFIFIILTTIIAVLIISQSLNYYYVKNIEQYSYTVIRDYQSFEIRQYPKAIFAQTTLQGNTYRSEANSGFKTLAGYIFGGNESASKIAMTAPVAVKMGERMEMEFMMPAEYSLESLPKPSNPEITLYEKPEVTLAALRFGGFASDKKISRKINELKSLLEKQQIPFSGEFQYFGYNPPFQLFKRRNEIVVMVSLIE